MEKKTVISLVALGLVLALGFLLIVKPRLDMRELAKETCDELDGAIVLVAGPLMKKAIGKAERLGFSAPDLGGIMREECPGLMQSLDRWSEEHR